MRPWLGVATVSVGIPGAGSLKDRRQVVRSLTDRLKRSFNASCADLGPDEVWDRAELASVCAGSSSQEMSSRMDRLCSFVERAAEEGGFVILDMEREVFVYGDF